MPSNDAATRSCVSAAAVIWPSAPATASAAFGAAPLGWCSFSAAATRCSMRCTVAKSSLPDMSSTFSSMCVAIRSEKGLGLGMAFSTPKSTRVRKTSRQCRSHWRPSASDCDPTEPRCRSSSAWPTLRATLSTFCSARRKKLARSMRIAATASAESTSGSRPRGQPGSAKRARTSSRCLHVASATQPASSGMRNMTRVWPLPRPRRR
mmetsp:Transcript_6526/g.21030  ORF Transcript_6526/g.21030 Transcript_6526/m.21030 type:complete len:207 (+) Transcript_6526:2782-3402(+)